MGTQGYRISSRILQEVRYLYNRKAVPYGSYCTKKTTLE